MRRSRLIERGGGVRTAARTRRLLLTALAAGISMMSGRAFAQDFSGRAIISDQSYSTDDVSSHLFDQLYEARFTRQVTNPFSYLLFFRGEQSDGHSTVGDVSTSARFLQLEPHAEATYTLPKLNLFGRYDLIETTSNLDGQPEDHRRLEGLMGSFAFHPEDLPGAHFYFQRAAVHDAVSSIDQTQTDIQAGIDFQFGKLLASALARRSDFDDTVNGLSRRTDGVQGSLGYQNTFFSNRLSVFANAQATYAREVDTTRLALVSAETLEPIVRALFSVDPTPEDSRDNPGIPTPGLIDGNFTAGTIVSVGFDGTSFQNITVDLGRFTKLDMFHIYVRDSTGNLVPRGGTVDFTVYTSQDEILWTPVFGNVSTTFVTVFSRYDVTFPATTSRFFKVVSFDLAPTQALVTEIQAVVHKSFSENSTLTTDFRYGTETAALSYLPAPGVTLSYNGNFNQSHQTPDTRQETSTNEANQFVSGSWDATQHLNLFTQYEWQDVRSTGDYSQSYRALTADLKYTAWQNVNVTLQGISSSQNDSGVKTDTDTAAILTYLRFLRTLDLSANIGVQRVKLLNGRLTSDQFFASGYSTADLTKDLHFRLTFSYTENRNQLPSLGIRPDTEERYTGDLFYRPGPQLGLDVQIGWVRTGNQSSPTQNYLVDWRPFPYGALRLGGRYEEDVEPFTHRRSRRLILDPSWTLNPHAIIDLNYTVETETRSSRTNIFFAGLTVTM